MSILGRRPGKNAVTIGGTRSFNQVKKANRQLLRADAHDLAMLEKQSRKASSYPRLKYGSSKGNKAVGGAGRYRFRDPALTVSTRVFSAAYPFLGSGTLPASPVYVGDSVHAGAFCFDPWDLYQRQIISGLSAIVVGMQGYGKSVLTKSLAERAVLAGICRVAVNGDIKNEWSRLCRWLGGKTFRVAPGSNERVNPLDPGVRPKTDQKGAFLGDTEWHFQVQNRRENILRTILMIMLDRTLEPYEQHVVTSTLSAFSFDDEITIPDVAAKIRNTAWATAAISEAADVLMVMLNRLATGDMAGMFDGPTTAKFTGTEPMITVDTSALRTSSEEAKRILSAATGSWLESLITNRDSGRWWMVYEEGWDQITGTAELSRMVRQWKLARDYGIFNQLVLHKFADLAMAGDQGSKMEREALSLMKDAETKIMLRQDATELSSLQNALGLSDTEVLEVSRMKKGSALWKVGNRPYMVQNMISATEKQIFDTDAKIATDRPYEEMGGLLV